MHLIRRIGCATSKLKTRWVNKSKVYERSEKFGLTRRCKTSTILYTVFDYELTLLAFREYSTRVRLDLWRAWNDHNKTDQNSGNFQFRLLFIIWTWRKFQRKLSKHLTVNCAFVYTLFFIKSFYLSFSWINNYLSVVANCLLNYIHLKGLADMKKSPSI